MAQKSVRTHYHVTEKFPVMLIQSPAFADRHRCGEYMQHRINRLCTTGWKVRRAYVGFDATPAFVLDSADGSDSEVAEFELTIVYGRPSECGICQFNWHQLERQQEARELAGVN